MSLSHASKRIKDVDAERGGPQIFLCQETKFQQKDVVKGIKAKKNESIPHDNI